MPTTRAAPSPRPPAARAVRAAAVAIVLAAAVLCAAAWAMLAAALQPLPAVTGPGAGGGLDLQRGWALMREHDPRRLQPGQSGAVQLTQAELQLLLDQAALRLPVAAAARAHLLPQSLRLQASLEWPGGRLGELFGRWLNLEAELRQTDALPAVASLRLGRLPVPGLLADAGLRWWLARQPPGAVPALDVLRQLRFASGRLEVDYVWGADTTRQIGAALLPAEDRERLALYARRLAEAATGGSPFDPWPLPQALQAVFTLARERSANEAEAAHENRAALRALAFYATGRNLLQLLPGARAGLPATGAAASMPRPLLLQGRVDFPQHYVVSAALAAEGGGPLADAIGLYKELIDAREGSGFSFNDIAADRAGARMGLLAVQSPQALQQRMANGVPDKALLPDVSDLPEYLPEHVFRSRYGRVGSPAYEAVLADIENRLLAAPLLR